jgi:hypothetical protein
MASSLVELLQSYSGDCIIVTHASCIRYLAQLLSGHINRPNIENFLPDSMFTNPSYCSLTIFHQVQNNSFDECQFSLQTYACVKHLSVFHSSLNYKALLRSEAITRNIDINRRTKLTREREYAPTIDPTLTSSSSTSISTINAPAMLGFQMDPVLEQTTVQPADAKCASVIKLVSLQQELPHARDLSSKYVSTQSVPNESCTCDCCLVEVGSWIPFPAFLRLQPSPSGGIGIGNVSKSIYQ